MENSSPKSILQAEEQILEHVEEEPDISTPRFVAAIEVSKKMCGAV